MNRKWTFNSHDIKAAKNLSLFLPEMIFDIYAHIKCVPDLNLKVPGIWSEDPSEVSITAWSKHLSKFPDGRRPEGRLFFPAPSPGANLKKENDYRIAKPKYETPSRGLKMVSPDNVPEELEQMLKQPGIIGMNPYHFYSTEHPTLESSIRGFFPEWQTDLANSTCSVIMLHLVKKGAVADADNPAPMG